MQNQLSPLQIELQTDPQNLGYADKAPREVHALLTAPNREIYVEPKTSDVANYLFNSGMSAALIGAKLSANYPQFPDALKVAMEFAINLRADNTPTMNFNNAGTRQMTGAFVAAHLWTQAQVDGLLNALAIRHVSRSVELLGYDVSIAEVSRVVWASEFMAEDAIQGASRTRVNLRLQGIDPDEVTN